MNKLNHLSSMIVAAMSAMVAAAERRFMVRYEKKQFLEHGAHVTYRWPSHKTTTAAQLKRAAKKRANARARSKK